MRDKFWSSALSNHPNSERSLLTIDAEEDVHAFNVPFDLSAVSRVRILPYGDCHIKLGQSIFTAFPLCNSPGTLYVCHPKALITWFPNVKSILPNPNVVPLF